MFNDLAIRNPIAISLGAVSGALSRYYLNLWFVESFGDSFPYGTFFINITGCFVMGLFFTLATETVITITPEVRLLIATGFLGSYTTFSTYGLDTVSLISAKRFVPALIYGVGSAIVGIISIKLGIEIVRWLK
ncbi:fluoride efflux transporter CrcB [Synechocystis sp. PCC 7509]|uniref:fluoride efflux transporter CrcB n=1 Tax=Synechocystis sp. PCC 7509 TaxID=927677 RepID=UPI0002ACD490|nr:fluoride efflux transporter CrcB [Synechocystis sp. PCC 7509]